MWSLSAKESETDCESMFFIFFMSSTLSLCSILEHRVAKSAPLTFFTLSLPSAMTLYRLGNGLGKGLCPLAARRSLHSSATTSYSVINTPEIRAKTISDAAKWLRTEGKKYRITTADPSPVAASTAVVSGSESTDSAAVPEKSVKKQSKPRDASKATLSMEGPVFVAGDRVRLDLHQVAIGFDELTRPLTSRFQ